MHFQKKISLHSAFTKATFSWWSSLNSSEIMKFRTILLVGQSTLTKWLEKTFRGIFCYKLVTTKYIFIWFWYFLTKSIWFRLNLPQIGKRNHVVNLVCKAKLDYDIKNGGILLSHFTVARQVFLYHLCMEVTSIFIIWHRLLPVKSRWRLHQLHRSQNLFCTTDVVWCSEVRCGEM